MPVDQNTALRERECSFSVADIAMVSVLRESRDTDLVEARPRLAGYVESGLSRPAFAAALQAQLAELGSTAPAAA